MFDSLRNDPMAFLRGVLRLNAGFSILSGIAMIVGGTAMAAWVGREGSLAPDGMILLVFAAVILWITRNETVNLKAAWAIVALDGIYVLDTARQILTGQFSTAGAWFFGVVCLLVLDLALMQAVGALSVSRRAASLEANGATA